MAAALYAGLFLNVAFFQALVLERNTAGDPLALLGALAVLAGMLVWGAYLPAARAPGQTLAELLTSRFGRWPAMAVCRVLLPAWAAAWFAENATVAGSCLDGLPLAALAVWVGLTVLDPLPTAPFLVKVAVAATAGLLLSTWQWLPGQIDELAEYAASSDRFVWTLLLWALPALLLAGHFPTSHPRRVALFGVALPLVAGAGLAIFTMAGASGHSIRLLKFPHYLGYAGLRPHTEGWVKLLVLAFTLLPAARFAVWTGRLAAGWPASMVSTCSVAALFAAVTYFWGTHWWGRYPAWMILGLPFAPLAGVLAARPAPPTISAAA